MKCENCGQELNEGDIFCANCGSAVNNNVADVNKDLELSGGNDQVIDNTGGTNTNEVITNEAGTNISDTGISNNNLNDSDTEVNPNSMSISSSTISNNNDNSVDSLPKKGKKKSKIIIILLVVFVAIIGALVALYLCTRKSPKNIFVTGFKKSTDLLLNGEQLKKKSLNQSIKFNISGTGLGETADIYNKIGINNNMAIDTSVKKLDEEISLSYDGSNILGIGIYERDNNIYLGFDKLYDKYVKIPVEDGQDINSFKVDNKVLKSALDNAFIKTFDDKYFTKSKEKVNIGGDYKNVDAYTLTIDNNNIKEIAKNFINNLVNDKEFIKMISDIYGIDSNQIKQSVNEIDYSEIILDAPLSITIYTKGFTNSFVGIEFAYGSGENAVALKIFKKDNNNALVTLKMGVTSIDANINKKESGNKSTVTTSIDLMGVMNLSMVVDSSLSNDAEFKNIDNKDVVDFDYFLENDADDVINNISKNKKLVELISELEGGSGSDVDYSSFMSIY